VTDSPYVASILASTHHETAKPETKVTVSAWGSVAGGGLERLPMRFGTRPVQVLKTVRQLVQGVPSEGAAATTRASRGAALRHHLAGIATELGRVHAVTLAGSAGTVTQTTPPSDAATGFLGACGIDHHPGSPT
jgi:hypothetical protein